MKILEKDRAIDLRRQGRTFNEILKDISVSKGSLSHWLREINLTDKQLARIRYKNEKIKRQFIRFNELKRKQSEENKKVIINNAAKETDVISKRELKLIGIALYWSEGYKGSSWGTVNFTNSDPGMIALMMNWFRIICKVPNIKFRIRIQCYGKGRIKKSKEYWSRITGVPLIQFTKPYTRITPTSTKKMGNLCPYGICNIRISDIALLSKVKGWIKGLKALSSSLA
ncbi:MAG: hypothetical protein ABIG46_03820 [Candidatus Omnitrophota bacterium]